MMNLTRRPLRVLTKWETKMVTTDPPKYTPHTEWSLVVTLIAPTPVRVIALLVHGPDTSWALQPAPPSEQVELRALFSPFDWRRSEEVGIRWEGLRWSVTDRALKVRPPEVVLTRVPRIAETGEIFPVAELTTHASVLSAMAVVQGDTERRRMRRWRIRPRLAENGGDRLVALASGRQSGEMVGFRATGGIAGGFGAARDQAPRSVQSPACVNVIMDQESPGIMGGYEFM